MMRTQLRVAGMYDDLITESIKSGLCSDKLWDTEQWVSSGVMIRGDFSSRPVRRRDLTQPRPADRDI